ncbi:MAG: hypothetical protein EBZ77_17710 [Chitinophagia bacterium]|nr:hypothetical protein [Chitinophagia bacterium]
MTDGDPTDEEGAARALARTEAPVSVVAYGTQYCFGTCDRMFKYARRRGGTSVLFARVEDPSELGATLASYGAHGLSVVGASGSRCYYNGAVVDFDGVHVVVVDPRRGLRVGFTGPVDVSSLALYGASLAVAPSVRHGMEVRDFLVATAVTEYAQRLALDRAGDAGAVLLRRARRLVPSTLAAVLAMLDSIIGEIERRTDDSTAVGRTVSGVVRALTCPA